MEFIMECILTAWVELAASLVPEGKMTPGKKLLFKCLAAGLILYVVAAFTAGAVMLSDQIGSLAVAVCLMTSAAVIFAAQIVLGIIFYCKRRKK